MNSGTESLALTHLRDVSEWQGVIEWSRYANRPAREQHELRALYLRAGRGPGILDKQAVANLRGSRVARLHVGAYWYLVPGIGSPEAQVDALLRLSPRRGGASLRPALDCEDGAARGHGPWYTRAILHARKRLGFWPTVYGSTSYLQELHLPRAIAAAPLWLASYDVARPTVPEPWTHWSAWQYTDKARDECIPGVRVDDSHVAQLRALVCPTRLQRLRGAV